MVSRRRWSVTAALETMDRATDRLTWYFVRLFRIDEKAEKVVREWLERERREER
jgi:hypothetical protein